MRAGPVLLRITAIVVFVQLLLGGLLTFDFISPQPHVIFGIIVFILALVTMGASLVTKPSFRPLQAALMAMAILILLQGTLGFVLTGYLPILGSGSEALSWLHFVNAMVIFGMAISGAFMGVRWDQIARKA
jgi:heme A synthase